MKLADGVSGHVDPATGRVKVMWRNREQQPDGSVKSRQKKLTADSAVKARELAVEIAAALREHGWWAPGTASFRPGVDDLELVFRAYLRHKVDFERVRPATKGNIARAFGRFTKGLQELQGLADDQVIAAELLTLPNYREWVAWAGSRGNAGEPYGAGTLYQTAHIVLDAWGWAADQGQWGSLAAPPYNRRAHLPPNPTYGPPTDTATWAEMDAAIARIHGLKKGATPNIRAAKYTAIIQRFTGLRLFQAAGISREDCDVVGNTLLIRRGKSQRERSLMRRVAVSPHLWDALRPVLDEVAVGPLFPDGKEPSVPMVSYRNSTRYVTRGWEQAVEDGVARVTVAKPPNREKASPTHCFRAGFMACLAEAGVSDAVLDHLVGHAPGTVRGKHYASPSMEMQHRAVALIPAVAELSLGSGDRQPVRHDRASPVPAMVEAQETSK